MGRGVADRLAALDRLYMLVTPLCSLVVCRWYNEAVKWVLKSLPFF
jgi:hypothetical protein